MGSRLPLSFTKKVHSGTPASSTTKTGPHDIAEILLKVALSTTNQNQISIRVSSLILKIPPTPLNKKSPKTTVKLSKKNRKRRRSYCFGLCEVHAYKHTCCYCFLPSLNMNQVPENCRIKKKPLTRRRRNKTSYLSILRLPHFICINLKFKNVVWH